MKININQLLQNIKDSLVESNISKNTAEQESWWLLQEITKKNKALLLKEKIIELSKEQKTKLDKWIKERVNEKKPLQYILGQMPFCNVSIIVKPPILIPRPETEYWISWLIEKLQKVKTKKLNILDMGCGSGCITLTIAKTLPNSDIFGIDINEKAIELSKENKKLNNIENATFILDNFEIKNAILKDKKFDLIISNPPYISEKEWNNLSNTIKKWEDKNSLVAAHKGYAAFEIIITTAKKLLLQNVNLKNLNIPQIILEIGIGQEENVEKLLIENNFINIKIYKDLRGINRWLTAGL